MTRRYIRKTAGISSLWQKLTALYRGKAYLLSWGIWRIVFAAQSYTAYYKNWGWKAPQTYGYPALQSYFYYFDPVDWAVHRICGTLLHRSLPLVSSGLVLVVMGLFGIPQCVRFLCFGPLESLLTAFLLHLRFYGPGKMLEVLSLWPEDIDNLLLCGLGILIPVLGGKISHKTARLP